MIITFSLLNDNAFWLLDNISLIDTNTSSQPIKNRDFEVGNLTDWNYCNPSNSANSSTFASNGSLASKSGQYFYGGAPYPHPDFLSQTIPTVMGRLYKFSFWLSKTATTNINNRFTATVFF